MAEELSKQGSGEAHLKTGQHAKIHTLFLQKVSGPYDQRGQKNMTFVLCSICMYLCVHARVCAYERQTLTLNVLFNLFLLIFGDKSFLPNQETLPSLFG